MKYDEAAEGIRKSGVCDGMSEAQTKKVVMVGLATGMNLSPEELTTRLNNKENIAPAPTQGPDKTDCGDGGVSAVRRGQHRGGRSGEG